MKQLLVLLLLVFVTLVTAGCSDPLTDQKIVHMQTADQSSSNLDLKGDVCGISDNIDQTNIDYIRFPIGLAPGSSPIDISQATVTFSSDTSNGVETLKNVYPTVLPKSNPDEVTRSYVADNLHRGEWGVLMIKDGNGGTDLLLEDQELFYIFVKPNHQIMPKEKISIGITLPSGTPYVLNLNTQIVVNGITLYF